jgi:hypothetical protein
MITRMREPFHTLIWKASIGYNDSWSQVDPEVLEKFAELIVKECMELCKNQKYDYWRSSEDQDFTPIDCADAIKRHFGVE